MPAQSTGAGGKIHLARPPLQAWSTTHCWPPLLLGKLQEKFWEARLAKGRISTLAGFCFRA